MRVIGVAAVLVILGCAAAIALLASTPFRQLDPVSAHLRACAVAELGAARVMAGIAGESPAAGEGEETPAGGGSFRCALRPAADGRVDLLVRGRFEGAEVVVHWRLETARPSLSARARAVPVHVAFAPEGSGLGAADLDRAAAEADRAAVARLAAAPRFESQRAALAAATPDVRAILGAP